MLILIGYVAVNKGNGKPSPGAQYSAGAKVYGSEAQAKSAVSRSSRNIKEYTFAPTFMEVPDEKHSDISSD